MLVKFIKKYKFRILRLLNTRRGLTAQKSIEALTTFFLSICCGRQVAKEVIKCASKDNKKLVRSAFHFIKYSMPKVINPSIDRFYNPVMFGFDPEIAKDFYLNQQKKHSNSTKVNQNLDCEVFLSTQLSQDPATSFQCPKYELEEKRLALKAKVAEYNPKTVTTKPQKSKVSPPKGSARPLLEKAFLDFHKEFKSHKEQFFVISGTLLGIVREGHLLDHDYDLDFGIYEDVDISPILQLVQQSDLFELTALEAADWGFYSGNCMIKLVHKNGINLDIFIHVERHGLTFHGGSRNVWFNTPFELRKHQCCDVSILGPSDTNQYLIENYGDWKTEKKDFDYNTDTPNYFLPHTPFSNYADKKKAVNK
ncbi:hypothetical protein [Neptuniibacter sp.]|uniref:hypothetical protein n=1 Tax=Neptuniibacter sp. TaxID=1962643 RepID=UPI003B5C33AC